LFNQKFSLTSLHNNLAHQQVTFRNSRRTPVHKLNNSIETLIQNAQKCYHGVPGTGVLETGFDWSTVLSSSDISSCFVKQLTVS